MRILCLVIFILGLSSKEKKAIAQGKDTSIFAFPIQLDEYTLEASRSGWDIAGFIQKIKTDTTFYKAFKTLRIIPYSAINDIRILGTKNEIIASLKSTTQQQINGRCRSMIVVEEKTTGDFYNRKRNYNYYTAELYAYLFFTPKTICGETNIVAGTENQRGKGEMEKRKWQLKQLIFNPGSKVAGVPFAGNKAAIFDPDVASMYNFKLMLAEYGGEDCYLFTATPKPEFKNEVVYNELSTWFRKSDYAIVARDYSLSFKTWVYDFDVRMKVRLGVAHGHLVPIRISYAGNWHIATQKRERAVFTTYLSFP
ncbi:MAG: hypothetical protein JSS78_08295 [Bacteroidetes bacterium]|nr:hypothetical protein [Bacteroidota bacterium]